VEVETENGTDLRFCTDFCELTSEKGLEEESTKEEDTPKSTMIFYFFLGE